MRFARSIHACSEWGCLCACDLYVCEILHDTRIGFLTAGVVKKNVTNKYQNEEDFLSFHCNSIIRRMIGYRVINSVQRNDVTSQLFFHFYVVLYYTSVSGTGSSKHVADVNFKRMMAKSL